MDWFQIGVGIALGAVIVVGLLVGKKNFELGELRPQVMVAIVALFVITLWAVGQDGMDNIATLAVGGLIALTSRVIEKDADPPDK